MEIDYINGPKTDKIFGMSKYQMEIIKRLDIDLNIIEFDSLMRLVEKKFSKNFSCGQKNFQRDFGKILKNMVRLPQEKIFCPRKNFFA